MTMGLFPVPVERYRMSDNSVHQDIKKAVYDIIKNTTDPNINDTSERLSHYKNRYNENILINDLRFKYFESWIQDKVRHFLTKVQGYEVKSDILITDCWINNCDSYGEQTPHCHANSMVSGTYYVNFNPLQHAKLEFYNHSHIMQTMPFFALEIKEETAYNTKSVIIDTEEQDLLLWPSHIQHGYSLNPAPERITISFNAVPEQITMKTYGFKISIEDLK